MHTSIQIYPVHAYIHTSIPQLLENPSYSSTTCIYMPGIHTYMHAISYPTYPLHPSMYNPLFPSSLPIRSSASRIRPYPPLSSSIPPPHNPSHQPPPPLLPQKKPHAPDISRHNPTHPIHSQGVPAEPTTQDKAGKVRQARHRIMQRAGALPAVHRRSRSRSTSMHIPFIQGVVSAIRAYATQHDVT